jgi:acetyl esterase/lipase
MAKLGVLAICVAAGVAALSARAHAGQLSSAPMQFPLWPGTPPDAPHTVTASETTRAGAHPVSGKPYLEVHDVSRPTMTIYPPKGKSTRAAMIVLPGGGYKMLAIDLEGTEVCDWLTAKGITCVLLKYRVPYSGPYWDAHCNCHITPQSPLALQDAQRAMGLVRQHAAEWHVDPHKVGVLGFSAGGHLSAAISTHFAQRSYAAVDEADAQSGRPDFAVLIYPGHLWVDEDRFELNPDILVTKETPPTFLLQAENDEVDDVNHSLVYYLALKKAGVPVELHLYAQGGHAFGLRRSSLPIAGWPRLVETWLKTIGMVAE